MSLQLENISKDYINGEITTRVLRGISLEVADGEFLALIGPSGSGKSTTMNIIGCLDRPTGGHYLLHGQDVSRLNERDLAAIRNRDIGFVFQTFNLLSQYTVQENVELPALYAHRPRGLARREAQELLASLGMSERLQYYPPQLSGGQKQRVAIARALINQPRLILADEPTFIMYSFTWE
ncbi:MAG: ABC transporter ATP-binding protein [Methanomassiliicoccales archaeon]